MPDSNLVYLVRHAKAGNRDAWDGDDTIRPLSGAGRRQADRLADTFAGLPPARLLSSPYLRCMQTLEPTAERAGLQVDAEPALAEGQPWEPVLELLTTLPRNSILCSHGDMIPSVIAALERRGAAVRTTPDWRKAATWVLERDGTQITAMSAVAPPGSDADPD